MCVLFCFPVFQVIYLSGFADKTKVLFQKKGNTAGCVSGNFFKCHWMFFEFLSVDDDPFSMFLLDIP